MHFFISFPQVCNATWALQLKIELLFDFSPPNSKCNVQSYKSVFISGWILNPFCRDIWFTEARTSHLDAFKIFRKEKENFRKGKMWFFLLKNFGFKPLFSVFLVPMWLKLMPKSQDVQEAKDKTGLNICHVLCLVLNILNLGQALNP